jgi:four helix bundle protein
MAFLFENLHVYQKAVDFAEQISNLTDRFPKGTYYLVDQVNRAALSISLNIAEGNGKFTGNDKKNFFFIARGSTHECVPLLEISKRRGFITEPECVKLRAQLEEIAKMISGMVKRYEQPQ